MILNKSAHERGFSYGTVYKSQIVDLKETRGASMSNAAPALHFGFGRDIRLEPGDKQHPSCQFLDIDGLPFIGTRVITGDPVAAYVDDTTGRTCFVKYKGDETAYVDQVRLLGACYRHFLFLYWTSYDVNTRDRCRRFGAAKISYHVQDPSFSCDW